jgi:hypothetical protein
VLLPHRRHARDRDTRALGVNRRLFIAVAARDPDAVRIDLYELGDAQQRVVARAAVRLVRVRSL